MALNDASDQDTLDPRRLRLPEMADLPREGPRFVYDRRSDTTFADFYGQSLPAISVAIDDGDRDYLYLRVEPETHRVVGTQIEAFLAYAIQQRPDFLELLLVADLRGYDDLTAEHLRRRAAAAADRLTTTEHFLDGIHALIA